MFNKYTAQCLWQIKTIKKNHIVQNAHYFAIGFFLLNCTGNKT